MCTGTSVHHEQTVGARVARPWQLACGGPSRRNVLLLNRIRDTKRVDREGAIDEGGVAERHGEGH